MEEVSNGELYRLVQGLQATAENHRREGSTAIEAMRSEMNAGFQSITVRQDKTNGRVSDLEKWQWFIWGALAILGLMNIPARLVDIFTTLK